MGIESVSEYDAAEILLLINEHFPYMHLGFERLVKRIHHPQFFFQKAMEKENLVGYAEWQILNPKEGIIQLNGIVVKPWHQGKGYGKILMEAGEKWARKKKLEKIRLLVATSNENAKKLYRLSGFAFKKIHPKKIGGEKAEVWEKKLVL